MKRTLLVLAAGMGSRYGGLKQIEPVGPNGETIIDYSIFDAIRAGFERLVFVIRRDIERPFKELVGSRFEGRLPVEYVFQELDKVPAGFAVPAQRKKPWGTSHAILMAAEAIDGPFAVINADDFYGKASYELLAEHLKSDPKDYAMMGFVLKNTLSEFGSVARGLCRTSPDGYLEGVTELTKIEKDGAAAKNTELDGKIRKLTGEELVSMNMWGFGPSLFAHLKREFALFLKERGQEEKSEFYIPTLVNTLVERKLERVKVIRTPAAWFGVTYREDRPRVVESIRELIKGGEYPEMLS
jgi:NDP-sugar pyrophosphorylase family protein